MIIVWQLSIVWGNGPSSNLEVKTMVLRVNFALRQSILLGEIDLCCRLISPTLGNDPPLVLQLIVPPPKKRVPGCSGPRRWVSQEGGRTLPTGSMGNIIVVFPSSYETPHQKPWFRMVSGGFTHIWNHDSCFFLLGGWDLSKPRRKELALLPWRDQNPCRCLDSTRPETQRFPGIRLGNRTNQG